MWKKMLLGEICQINSGNSIPKKTKDSKFTGINGMPYIATKDISFDGKVNYENGISISDSELNKFKISPKESILICAEGGSAGKKIAYVDQDCCYVNKLFSIKTSSKVLPRFIFYYLKSVHFHSQFKKALTGLIGGVSLSKIKKLQIIFPESIKEQLKIISKLDNAFSEIESCLAKLTKIEKNTSDIFEILLDEISNASGPFVSLKEVCDIKAKLVNPKDFPYIDKFHIGAGNMISLSNEPKNVLTAKEEKLISPKFPFNDDCVLYSKIRPYLRKVHLPSYEGICSADIYPLIPDTQKLKREYLYYLLLSKNFTKYAMSGSARSGMPKVNRNHLFDYSFPLPSIEVQRAQVEKIKVASSITSKLQKNNANKIKELKKLKSSILSNELKGSDA